MVSWRTISRGHLGAAKILLSEGFLRGSVNRAYYSAYSAIAGRLIDAGAELQDEGRRNPTHKKVVSLALNGLDPKKYSMTTRKDLSRRLRTLRRFRVVADYQIDETIDKHVAITCVRDAAMIYSNTET